MNRTAQLRAAGMRAPADRPRHRRSAEGADSLAVVRVAIREAQVTRSADGAGPTQFAGYASITDTSYTMWDFFGEYAETVTSGAFGPTLAASPMVEFVLNHGRNGGPPMAHTRNGTLRLSEDAEGLRVEADLDQSRHDVHDMLAAIERGDLAEMSFRFRIVRGRWSDSFDEYFIHEVDLDGGDVSPVNFGANPHTYIETPARSDAAPDTLARDSSAAPVALGDLPAEPTITPEQEPTPMSDLVALAAPTVEPNTDSNDITELRAAVARLTEEAQMRAAAQTTAPAYDQVARVGAEQRSYTPENDRCGARFVRDLGAAQMGDYDARDRLARHMREERVERAEYFQRDIGTSAFAGLTVPQYLVDLFAPVARAGRPLADNCRRLDLPPDGMTVVLSRGTTGTTAAAQSAEAAAASETDFDDTALTVNVRTVTGQQDVSFQALARSVGAQEVLIQDLVSAYHTQLDSDIINAAGTSGTHLGIRSTTSISTATLTDSSPTPAEALGSLYEIQATIEGAVFKTPTAFVMAPRRWHWFRAAIGTDLALVGQGSAYPPQAFGNTNNDVGYGPGVRGDLAGLPVIVDANIPLTVSSTQDVILCVNLSELFLWEDPGAPLFIRADQPGAGNLMSKLVVYGYSAFTAGRYPAAHGVISGSGLAAPSAYGKTIS